MRKEYTWRRGYPAEPWPAVRDALAKLLESLAVRPRGLAAVALLLLPLAASGCSIPTWVPLRGKRKAAGARGGARRRRPRPRPS